jgi:hypothetical protein
MSDLFTEVMEHQEKYAHVTTTQGAFAFNQAFEEPVLMEEQTKAPTVHVEIIDAVSKVESDWAGVKQYHIEYLMKMSIEGNTSKIKIVSKRFSELADLHKLLWDRRKVDPTKAPAFPDKNNLHQNWWKMNDKDPSSEFVQQRLAALETYFKKLFDTHPGLPFDPMVMAFFQLEELSVEVALATSVKMAKYAEKASGTDTAHVAPVGRKPKSISTLAANKKEAVALTDDLYDV